jgi:RNA polymerase sigma-70 factor (ECF subfamily)
MSNSQAVISSYLQICSEDLGKEFWEQWQQYQDHLHLCCIKWMGENRTNADSEACRDSAIDVLSQAMLKACNQWQKDGGKIKNPKAWFTRIVHNLCMDVHRKSKREAQVIENIDDITFEAHSSFSSSVDVPESNILALEMRAYLRHKIESLPTRLRTPFVLYYCQEKSCKDIAKQLACSEESVCKCLRKAREILQRHLNKYLSGEDDTSLYSPSSSLKLRICLEEKSQLECNWEPPITTKSKNEEISYKVTVICLETLSHHWCSSANLLSCR